MKRVLTSVAIGVVLITAAPPALAVTVDLSGSNRVGSLDNPMLEELDGVQSLAITVRGANATRTIRLTAVGGVLDFSPTGLGVSPVDTQSGAGIEGQEAVLIQFDQPVRWTFFALRSASGDGNSSQGTCVELWYRHGTGEDQESHCASQFIWRADAPLDRGPIILADPAQHSVQVRQIEGGPVVIGQIAFEPADPDDSRRGICRLAFDLGLPRIEPGHSITSSVRVENEGPDDATGLSLRIDVTGGTTLTSANAPAGTSFDMATGVWTVGRLPLRESHGYSQLQLTLTGGFVEGVVSVSVIALDQLNNGATSANQTVDVLDSQASTFQNYILAFLCLFGLGDEENCGCGSGSMAAAMITAGGLWIMPLLSGRRRFRRASRRGALAHITNRSLRNDLSVPDAVTEWHLPVSEPHPPRGEHG